MKNPKKKGNLGEAQFSEWLRENGYKAWRNSSSGAGQIKGDINNTMTILGEAVSFEVKTVAKLNLMKAWRQCNGDSSKAHTTPVLATHFNNMPAKTWLITIHSEDFMTIIKEIERMETIIRNYELHK